MKKSNRVISEKFSDPVQGEIVKTGDTVSFTFHVTIQESGLKDMAEAKKHMERCKTIIKKYSSFISKAKCVNNESKKENKLVKATLARMGFINES